MARYLLTVAVFFITLSAIAQKEKIGLSNPWEEDKIYGKEWQDIDTTLYNEALTKTALAKVETLYKRAVKEKHPDQVIKALIYRYSLMVQDDDDKAVATMSMLKDEISNTNDEVAKSILYSLLARQYQDYYNRYRWQLYNRSKTNGYTKDDITTWSADDFSEAIRNNYFLSVQRTASLQKVPVDRFNVLLMEGNTRNLRPTLYDLLMHEALDYFQNGDYYLTKPAYAFELNDARGLLPAKDFINHSFTSKDSTSTLLLSLRLFQQLIAFHMNDANKDALIDVDLERLRWVKDHITIDESQALYINALQQLADAYPTDQRTTAVYMVLATELQDQGRNYQPWGDTTYRWNNVKALQVIDKALQQFGAKDSATYNLRMLKESLLRKQAALQVEKVNIPGKPFRVSVTWSNTDKVFIRLVKIDRKNAYLASDEYNDEDELAADGEPYNKMKPFRSFTQALPYMDDHQQHRTEIKIDALPVGEYLLISSTGEGFADSTDNISYQPVYISNISYVNSGRNFFVVHRETGKPLQKIKVSAYQSIWSNKLNRNIRKKVASFTTDKNGGFKLAATNDYTSYEYAFASATDSLHIRESVYSYEYGNTANRKQKSVSFFTDRSIYRPGQTMYFKGIAINIDRTAKQNKLITNDSVKVVMYDANGKQLQQMNFMTNSYGSFSGKYVLPQNLLNGSYRMEVTGMNAINNYFRVEEYKRPAFYVEFDKVKGSYRLGDSITVTGYAKAYAGNPIDGANVKLNVIRNIDMLYKWVYPVRNNQKQVMNTQVTTDANGKFSVTFLASSDKQVNESVLYHFNVTADVTDMNGETHSDAASVPVGRKSLLLSVSVPEVVIADSLKQIRITTTNLSDEAEAAQVQVNIYPLQTPQRLIRERLWERPDVFVMNKEAYISTFPNDEYDNETDKTTWSRGSVIFSNSINTKDTNLLTIKTLPAGYYKIEAITKDKEGNEVKDIRFVEVFNGKEIAYPRYNFDYATYKQAEPGEAVTFYRGTAATDLFLIRRSAGIDSFSFINMHKGMNQTKYNIKESDRGGIGYAETFVYNNRVYAQNYFIQVPWSNKTFQVAYTSYRNKTEPGNKETWTIEIRTNSDKVAAELLTGMYDASLDMITPHAWLAPQIWPINNSAMPIDGSHSFGVGYARNNDRGNADYIFENYDHLATEASQLIKQSLISDVTLYPPLAGKKQVRIRGVGSISALEGRTTGVTLNFAAAPGSSGMYKTKMAYDVSVDYISNKEARLDTVAYDMSELPAAGTAPKVVPRKNFNETAFFFPALYPDPSGKVSFSFTMPEALTEWKWMSLAHTRDLSFGTNEAKITAAKTVMVQPNAPRFVREGDIMQFVAKVANTSDKEITGQATLQLIDATTGTSVDGWFQNAFPVQYFTVPAKQSSTVKFPIQIPFSYNKPLTWKVIATSGAYSDGEENTLPVLPNRMLVTESLPLYMKPGNNNKQFTFEKLLNNNSESLTTQSLTVEYTANPVWSAVQSLPYLIAYPYECAEQTFNRYYANSLSTYLVKKYPRIEAIFNQWRGDTTALLSNLQKNQELKQVLLEETPWVLDATNEQQQKKNISMLFEAVAMKNRLAENLSKLQAMQMNSGAFSWFKGGSEDRYITNYILTGVGKLKQLGAVANLANAELAVITKKGLAYLDAKATADYERILRSKNKDSALRYYEVTDEIIQYLFMRSFFSDENVKSSKFYQYFYSKAKQQWNKQRTYYQAMIAVAAIRNGDQQLAVKNILPAIIENAIEDTVKGTMYWKDRRSCFWYSSPIEHQSMMIMLLSELNKVQSSAAVLKNINAAKTWLLLNKQTNNWGTTIATADACFALLNTGSDWVNNNQQVTVYAGSEIIAATSAKAEAGTGYIKQTIKGEDVKPDMGRIRVEVKPAASTASPSWGAVYWQYFEDMDKITPASSPLSIRKKLFIEKNTDAGKVLQAVNNGDELSIGDKLVVRLELSCDRDMEYVHVKDLRAAGVEPVNVLSGYKWQQRLSYYESTKDVSSNYFIDRLYKGTYVLEYPSFVTHSGEFSAGIATVQCMYAPEMTAHSEGIRIKVKE